METNEIDALSGQIAGLSEVITSIITTLPRLKAAQAAVALALSREENQRTDELDMESFAHHRDNLVEQFLQLLSAVAKRDE
jgi:hypothetical protein